MYALHQDQHANVTNSLTKTTNAKFAQSDNCLMLVEQDAYQEPTAAEPDNQYREINSHAMLADNALTLRFQIRIELLVFQDHLLTADV
jgi:hypothetical protein